MKIKVSVIVPVYNVEKYVDRCLKSLVQQDLKEIEIIIVNDGSTDKSTEICKCYAKKYPNIKYISQHNQGLSVARNAGIKVAEGEYIGFVDSDDFVKKGMFSLLYGNAIKHNVQISCCGYEEYYNNGKTHALIASGIRRLYNRGEALDLFLLERYFGVISCNKIFKRELFKNVKFPVGKLYEDILTIYKLIDLANGLYYDSTIMYFYYRRTDSLSTSQFNPNTLELLNAVDEVVAFYKQNIGKPKYLYVGQALFYLQVLSKMYCAEKDDKKLVSSIRQMINRHWKEIFLTRKISIRGKAKLFVVWISPQIYKKLYVDVSQLRDDFRNK